MSASLWPDPAGHPASATAKKAEQLKMGFDLACTPARARWPMEPRTRAANGSPSRSPCRADRFDQVTRRGPMPRRLASPGTPGQPDRFHRPSTHELVWEAPIGTWQIFGLFDEASFEGLDPFSPTAIKDSLFSFDLALADYDGPFPRSRPLQRTAPEFADWTPGFFEPFLTFRGYDLREQLALLEPLAWSNVSGDYRETLSDVYAPVWFSGRSIHETRVHHALLLHDNWLIHWRFTA